MSDGYDDLDKQIIDLISRRFAAYIEELKRTGADASQLFAPADRGRLFEMIESMNKGPLSSELFKRIYTELLTHASDLVKPVTIAYLGPAGTFTHLALRDIFGETAQAIPMKTIHDVFTEVETGRVTCGVVPVENSTEGAVTYTLDELLDTDLKIVAEKSLRISYSLASVAKDMKSIKKLYSHPQSFGQCKEWIRKNLPNAELHHVNSNALAAETASWDKLSGAITSEVSAEINRLNVLATGIEDSKQNHTRFLVIGRTDNPPTGRDKTSIVCALKDKPGALYNMLQPFSDAGINMTKIESRPDKKKMWEYNFFIDFIGHRNSKDVVKVIEQMRDDLIFLKILGSYPIEN
ncbi:MAG: prephenate dehydratase [Spirochaetes bacterium]|nr:MAG: prephenate dehydratase [Spirochaetota bacterium]